MITIKKPHEIELLRQGGKILAQTLHRVAGLVKPGITMNELDEVARECLIAHGGIPSFLGYGGTRHTNPYPATLCVSRNDEVVHGVGTRNIALQEGDIVGLDLGVKYPAHNGLFTDMALTVGVGTITPAQERLITVTNESLHKALRIIKPGVEISELSKVIQHYCESYGFQVVRDLTGHGVGYAVHEDPPIFNYYDKRMPKVFLKEHMVICIEPMVVMGDWRVTVDPDGWTIRTRDGSLSAHCEETIAVTKDGYEVLTKL